jgi:hypothetical protein
MKKTEQQPLQRVPLLATARTASPESFSHFLSYIMERADLVIVGAEGVVENGGVINKVGASSRALLKMS